MCRKPKNLKSTPDSRSESRIGALVDRINQYNRRVDSRPALQVHVSVTDESQGERSIGKLSEAMNALESVLYRLRMRYRRANGAMRGIEDRAAV